MPFDLGAAGQIDITTVLFKGILKISSTVVSQYRTVDQQLLWLILIPHFIIALFLVSAMKWIAGGHKGLQLMGAVVIYLFLILGGWYGSLLVPIVNQYFVITVGLMLVFFFLSRIFPPIYGPGAAKLGGAIAGKVGEHTIGRYKNRKAMEKRLEVVDRAIQHIVSQYGNDAKKMPDEASGVYAKLIVEREELKRKLEDVW